MLTDPAAVASSGHGLCGLGTSPRTGAAAPVTLPALWTGYRKWRSTLSPSTPLVPGRCTDSNFVLESTSMRTAVFAILAVTAMSAPSVAQPPAGAPYPRPQGTHEVNIER